VERVQRTWDERVFNHRREARIRAFNRLKYAPVLFFQLLFTSAARFCRPRNSAIYGAAWRIETIAINNLQYELRKTHEREKHRKKSIILFLFLFLFKLNKLNLNKLNLLIAISI